MKRGQPIADAIADLAAQLVEKRQVVGAGREDVENVREPGKVELGERGLTVLLDEEGTAGLAEPADDFELLLRDLESVDVIIAIGAR